VSNLLTMLPPTCGDVVALLIWLHDAMMVPIFTVGSPRLLDSRHTLFSGWMADRTFHILFVTI